ncbi:MAG: V-type ATPase subunit [Spirochaetaceae bacterium]|jgi:vacuolar-type H+-ATPase subunit C/Vma6|nr:V-type ATPase subunit [Spirochaetaceae bacterium]
MTAERSFIYAKCCGIIARSFVEGRISRLIELNSIKEFYSMVFGDSANSDLISNSMERAIINKTAGELLLILKSFKKTPEFLVRLVKSYESADLKNAITAIKTKKPAPEITPLGRFTGIKWQAYPDIKKMLQKTEYSFLLNLNIEGTEDSEIQAAIDKNYYSILLSELKRLNPNEIPCFSKLIAEEVSLINCSRALRLRVYYNTNKAAIGSWLIDEKTCKNGDSLARDAKKSLEFDVSHHADWVLWKRFRFLNPQTQNSYWKCDPCFFQHSASIYLYNIARKSFRRRPFCIDTAACFIRLKQFEEQLLCGVAEGLLLGVSPKEVLNLMGTAL